MSENRQLTIIWIENDGGETIRGQVNHVGSFVMKVNHKYDEYTIASNYMLFCEHLTNSTY